MKMATLSAQCEECISDENVAIQVIPILISRLQYDIEDCETKLIIDTVETCVNIHGEQFRRECARMEHVLSSLSPEHRQRMEEFIPQDPYIDPIND